MGVNKAAPPSFLAGGGEMGERMRTKDWSQTAVGPPNQWPPSLRTTVSLCLNAHLPILIWWGPDRVMLYNDAYRLILGDKHPHALGSTGRDTGPEDWDTLGPGLEGVGTRGEAHWSENQLLMVNRNGFPQAAYFSYSLSPIYDESDGIGGVFCVATETTDTMLAEQQRQQLDWIGQENRRTQQQIATSERRLAAIIRQTPLGVAIFRGPDFIIELANPTICQLWGRTHQQVVDKPLFEALPEATGQGFEELLLGVYKTGIAYEGHELPVTLERHGQLETVYFDFVYDALRNADERIERTMVVATEVTRVRQARQQIEVSEANLQSLFQQAPVAIAILRGPQFVVELANPGICTVWNRTEAQLLGHP
ncbi:PAS domain-containing protein, partial [Spirosoma arcticum]